MLYCTCKIFVDFSVFENKLSSLPSFRGTVIFKLTEEWERGNHVLINGIIKGGRLCIWAFKIYRFSVSVIPGVLSLSVI